MENLKMVHVAVRGTTPRKVTLEQFKADVEQGLVSPEAMVWSPGSPDWQRARMAFPELFGPSTPLSHGAVPPQGYQTGEAPPPPPPALAPSGNRLAHPGMRALALLLDGVIIVPAIFVVMVVLSPLAVIPILGEIALLLLLPLAALIIPLVIGCVCPASKLEGTPGQALLGLRMENRRGQRLSRGQGICRGLVSVLSFMPLGLGYLWGFLSDTNQTWHDSICQVYVTIKENPHS